MSGSDDSSGPVWAAMLHTTSAASTLQQAGEGGGEGEDDGGRFGHGDGGRTSFGWRGPVAGGGVNGERLQGVDGGDISGGWNEDQQRAVAGHVDERHRAGREVSSSGHGQR